MTKILLKNVKLSYPHLYEKYNNTRYPSLTPKYEAKFIISNTRNPGLVEQLQAMMAQALKGTPLNTIDKNHMCLKKSEPNLNELMTDAEKEKEITRAADEFILKGKTADEFNKIDKTGKRLVAQSENLFRPGCYVNVQVNIESYNTPCNGVRAKILGIQFVAESDFISEKKVSKVPLSAEELGFPDMTEEDLF